MIVNYMGQKKIQIKDQLGQIPKTSLSNPKPSRIQNTLDNEFRVFTLRKN